MSNKNENGKEKSKMPADLHYEILQKWIEEIVKERQLTN